MRLSGILCSERGTKGRQKNGNGKNSTVYGLSVSYPQRRQSGKVSHLYGSIKAQRHRNKRVRSDQFALPRLKIRKITPKSHKQTTRGDQEQRNLTDANTKPLFLPAFIQ